MQSLHHLSHRDLHPLRQQVSPEVSLHHHALVQIFNGIDVRPCRRPVLVRVNHIRIRRRYVPIGNLSVVSQATFTKPLQDFVAGFARVGPPAQ